MRGLTDYQWIILWEINDTPGRVLVRQDDWFMVGTHRDHKITLQVKILLQRDLVMLNPNRDGDPLLITYTGQDALSKRDYMTVIDRWNSR